MTLDNLKEMNPEAKRIKVAALHEWEFHKIVGEFKFVSIHIPSGDVYHSNFGDLKHLPDYLNDLNSIQKAILDIQKKDEHFSEKFLYNLALVISDGETTDYLHIGKMELINATAIQRVDAFILSGD
jgi:hypothetical protein